MVAKYETLAVNGNQIGRKIEKISNEYGVKKVVESLPNSITGGGG